MKHITINGIDFSLECSEPRDRTYYLGMIFNHEGKIAAYSVFFDLPELVIYQLAAQLQKWVLEFLSSELSPNERFGRSLDVFNPCATEDDRIQVFELVFDERWFLSHKDKILYFDHESLLSFSHFLNTLSD